MTIAHFNAPAVSAPTISSASMLVELSISVWTGRKKDRAASDDVTRMNHANMGVASVNKKLLGDCEELVAIQKFGANVRSGHYAMTMPWSDSGLRLLPTKQFFKYNEQITALRAEFDRLVEVFLSAYDWEVMQAQTKLGNLFIRDEYPTVESLRAKFGFRLNYIPLPDAGDWRVDMEHETTASLKSQYAQFYQSQMEGAMRDVWERLHEHVTRFINQLGVDEDGKKGKIFQSTIDHVQSLTDMLGMTNFTNDPNLSLAEARLRAALRDVTQADLKNDEFLREDTKRAMEQAIAALPSLL
jgi:hypothetical protein